MQFKSAVFRLHIRMCRKNKLMKIYITIQCVLTVVRAHCPVIRCGAVRMVILESNDSFMMAIRISIHFKVSFPDSCISAVNIDIITIVITNSHFFKRISVLITYQDFLFGNQSEIITQIHIIRIIRIFTDNCIFVSNVSDNKDCVGTGKSCGTFYYAFYPQFTIYEI